MSTRPTSAPVPPEDLRRRAAERVEKLLAGRLLRGGLRTSRPEWYYQVEAAEPQAYPAPRPGELDGWQVQVHTWRHWSDARVHIDADTGEIMHRCVDRLAAPPTDAELEREEALRIAATVIQIPADARLKSFWHEYFADEHRVARLEWEHFHKDLRVDGDYL